MEGTKAIAGGAFYYRSELTSITIPDGIIDIGDSAFEGCSGLTSITITDGVASIEDDAFFECGNLKDNTTDKADKEHKDQKEAMIGGQL